MAILSVFFSVLDHTAPPIRPSLLPLPTQSSGLLTPWLTGAAGSGVPGRTGASVGGDAGAAIEAFGEAGGFTGVGVVAAQNVAFATSARIRARGVETQLLATAVGKTTFVDV